MGILGDLIDDVFDAPRKIVRGTLDASADLIAETLSLPLHVVEAAIKAGAKTAEEVRRFAEEHME